MTRRRALTFARALLALVATAGLLRAGPADAQAGDRLVGYAGSASASGATAQYNPAGLLPIAAPLDLGAPDALATIGNGPSTFARASAADPGDLLANPDALLSQADGYPDGSIPPYRYRVQASSGVGEPDAESAPGAGLDARVHADTSGSRAAATMPALEGPAALTVGSLSAESTTTFDGSTITVHARSRAEGADLLGVVRIDSVVTDLTAVTDGHGVELSGGTTVSGATVAGQPVTIDATGVHQQGPTGSPNPGLVSLNDLLATAGIRITVSAPFQQSGTTSGQLASAGLRIDIEISDKTLPVLATLRGAAPPIDNPIPGTPGIEDVLAATKARHLTAIGLGRGAVSLTARTVTATEPATPTAAGTSAPAAATSSTGGATTAPATRTPGVSLAAAAPAAAEAATTGSAEPASAAIGLGEGVGIVALLALLVQPLIGDRLVRSATGLLDESALAACPREGR